MGSERNCPRCGGVLNSGGRCNGFIELGWLGGELTPCENNIVRMPSITAPDYKPCPCCAGTGKLREPKLGEMTDA